METFHETDLLIIGSGMAGMSAAVFAANQKINAVLAGGAGGFEYSSGLMDLWGVSVTEKNKIVKTPWDMMSKLIDQSPDHPYARLTKETLNQAFSELTAALKTRGLTYTGQGELNSFVMTPFGSLRPTYRVPATIQSNVTAFQKKEPCLILDFRGLREFSAVFFKEMLKKNWKSLRTQSLEFPDTQIRSEVFTPFLARSMETRHIQSEFIHRVKSLLKEETYLGLPAVLGVLSCEKIHRRMEDELGVTIFEIPTSPVSVPGIRLKDALRNVLESSSVTIKPNQRVIKVLNASDQGFECRLDSGLNSSLVRSKAVLLSTGRFLGRGLRADRKKIHETIFDLPVFQPKTRNLWHSHSFFNKQGHAINQAGIETDALFRPVNQNQEPIYNRLFASGSILAHQDWMRTKSGTGISIGTSYQAIQSFLQL